MNFGCVILVCDCGGVCCCCCQLLLLGDGRLEEISRSPNKTTLVTLAQVTAAWKEALGGSRLSLQHTQKWPVVSQSRYRNPAAQTAECGNAGAFGVYCTTDGGRIGDLFFDISAGGGGLDVLTFVRGGHL